MRLLLSAGLNGACGQHKWKSAHKPAARFVLQAAHARKEHQMVVRQLGEAQEALGNLTREVRRLGVGAGGGCGQ